MRGKEVSAQSPNIGVLGGTFDPVHLGHLLIAQAALEQAGLDRVVFIPCARPPHKPAPGQATAAQRWAMVRLAIRGNPRFAADDLELRRGGPSYTVDTLRELRRREPRARYVFIIGSDSLPDLPMWKEIDQLVRLCDFITVARPGFAPAPVGTIGLRPSTRRQFRHRVVPGWLCDVSSTDLRWRLAHGKSIRYLVPDPVRKYIEGHELYR